MLLYIMRHGETSWNTDRRIQGRTDVELNENGLEMVKKSAEGMKNIKFDYIYSSPLTRAYTTAEIILQGRDIPLFTDDRLMEVCFGEWEGRDITTRQDMLEAFFDHPETYVATGGAESYEDILGRARDFLEDVIYPLVVVKPDCKILITGHAAINRALSAVLKNTPIKDIWAPPHRKNCAVDIYELNEERIKVVEEAHYYF
ncbi:MAG: histidine phosphatase family protein [Lachnospiraceae bacterium]|nr:histidine phosphatase family protein [Lachnospiraceae bacterium]